MHDIFYFTDIHGMYDLYRAIMDYCHEQDDEAMIIFGGDACDRGERGYEIIKELLDNPRLVYLMGNHEELFCKAAREINSIFDFQTTDRAKIINALNATLADNIQLHDIQLHIYNGGLPTLIDWIEDGAPMDIIERLEKLPLTFSTDTCDFCHAGGNYQVFEQIAEDEYYERQMDKYFRTSILWDRNHIGNMWKQGRTCIFGHTPVLALPSVMHIILDDTLDPQPIRLAKGTKINMDTGAAFRGVAWVLNVLTMKAQGFEDIDITNKEVRKHDIKKIDCIQV